MRLLDLQMLYFNLVLAIVWLLVFLAVPWVGMWSDVGAFSGNTCS